MIKIHQVIVVKSTLRVLSSLAAINLLSAAFSQSYNFHATRAPSPSDRTAGFEMAVKGINDSGQLVGDYVHNWYGADYHSVWQWNGGASSFNVNFGDTLDTYSFDINNDGYVSGVARAWEDNIDYGTYTTYACMVYPGGGYWINLVSAVAWIQGYRNGGSIAFTGALNERNQIVAGSEDAMYNDRYPKLYNQYGQVLTPVRLELQLSPTDYCEYLDGSHYYIQNLTTSERREHYGSFLDDNGATYYSLTSYDGAGHYFATGISRTTWDGTVTNFQFTTASAHITKVIFDGHGLFYGLGDNKLHVWKLGDPDHIATIDGSAVRLDPVPEPATITALALGTFALLRRKRR